VTISERIETARRERRVLTRVSRAAWRLDQAERERERTWALVSARAEGISIRTLAQFPELSWRRGGTGVSLAWPERVVGVAGSLVNFAAPVSLGLPGVLGPLQLRG